ncbi:MAG: DUF1365 domain-containing protein [Actinomycetota bacterium]
MRAGGPALCRGSVWHKRLGPAEHEFRYDTSHVWLDPDRPDDLCDLNRWWSSSRPAPVRYRASDYGRADDPTPLSEQARDDLAPVLDGRPEGPVRLVSQLRRWGWLFNPISFHLVWHDDPDTPVGAVLEVTNTPWHERHRYAVALDRDGGAFRAVFDKTLHVSPFLDEDFRYRLTIADVDERFNASLDVVGAEEQVVVATLLDAPRTPADAATVAAATWRPVLPTHRVTLGIHAEAACLWRKGVPFVAHPDKRRPSPQPTPERTSP